MINEDSSKLHSILNTILYSIEGIDQIMVMDKDGILIKSLAKKSTISNELSQQVCALNGAMFETAIEQGRCVNLGEIEFQLTEYEHGFIVGRGMGSGILTLFTQKSINIGNIFQLLLEFEAPVSEILRNYLCDELNEVPEEIRSMFNIDLF